MPYQLFNIMLPNDTNRVLEAMNSFLSTHRIVSVTHRGYDINGTPYELFVVDYLSEVKTADESTGHNVSFSKEKIDYKKKLSPDDFEVYLQLTRLRKKLAEAEGVEVFMVYTNAQLAAMAENRPHSMSELEKINGIGDGRLVKFGKQTLDFLITLPEKTEELSAIRKEAEKGDKDAQIQ